MKITVVPRLSGNEPTGLTVLFPDWGIGGTRTMVDMSLWEALQLRTELDRVLPS